MRDPYKVLNVRRDADLETIKQAYRQLAKKFHPDRNPGDRATEQRFMDITAAYQLLSDPKARHAYDLGQRRSGRQTAGNSSVEQAKEVLAGWRHRFETMVGRWVQTPKSAGHPETDRSAPMSDDRDVKAIEVDFVLAAKGGKQRITMPDGKLLEVTLPPGIDDQMVLRLKGDGRGDLLVRIHLQPHPFFTRKGLDLHLDMPISLQEALLGAQVRTPTIDGAVSLTIPMGANSGQVLRLKGKGAVGRGSARGDQYVRLAVTLPSQPSAAMAADLKRLARHENYPVRNRFER